MQYCKEEEKLALKIYCSHFSISADKFLNIEKTESPDIQTKDNQIGIEVTQVLSSEEGKIDSLYEQAQQCLKDNKTIHNIKGINKYIVNKSIIIDKANNVAFFPIGDNIEPICSAIKNKLNKLQSYKIFKTNILFLFLKYQIHDKDSIEKTIVPIIKKLHFEYKLHFNQYILYDILSSNLFLIDENYNVCLVRK